MFKGFKEIENMSKEGVLHYMKGMTFPNWKKGGIISEKKTITVKRNSGYYELTLHFSRPLAGTDMSKHPPIVDGTQYTWNELKKYPAPLLKVLAYRLWKEHSGSEEE